MKLALTRAGAARWLARRLALLLVLAAGATALAAAASLHWFAELFSHFTPHVAAAALLFAATFLLLESPRWALAAALLAGLNVALIALNFATPKTPDAAATGARLSILSFNVGFRHEDPRRVVDYILGHAERFDVVVLIEAPPGWTRELARLANAYPHSTRALEESPWGIAVFSKAQPLESLVAESPDGTRHAEVRLALAGRARPVAIYAVHPPPPIGRVLAAGRNAKLEDLARRIRSRTGETAIVVGDFNLTPSSPYFRRFAEAAELAPAQGRAWPQSTWPALLASVGLGIAIDHAFVAPDVDITAYETGPDLGSDHLPIAVTFALR